MHPFGCGPQPDETDTDLVGDILDVAQVGVHLVAGLVDRLQWRAAQFQLSARFQADIRAVLFQPDQVAFFQHRRPAVLIAQPFQHRQHTAFARIGNGAVRVLAIAEFLVLGPDAPIGFRLAAIGKVFSQLRVIFDRPAAGLRNGHGRGLHFACRVSPEANAAVCQGTSDGRTAV